MVLYSPIAALPYPSLADIPNIQTMGQQLTSALDLITIPRFASSAAVSAAIPSPTNGQAIFRTDIGYGVKMTWSSTANRWIPDSTLIAEVPASNGASSVTFSGIPQDWKNLRIYGDSMRVSQSVDTNYGYVYFNGDNAANHYAYIWEEGLWYTSPVISTGSTGQGNRMERVYKVVGANLDGNGGGGVVLDIPSYSATGRKKCCLGSSTGGGGGGIVFSHDSWNHTNTITAAITSITIGLTDTGTWDNGGGSWRLYGWG